MRFTSVDNRSRSMWLLVGLGVLIWAAFSVFLSGSSAHADETPGPSAKHSQHQTSPQAAERSAHGVTQAASEVLRVITAPTAPVVTALREAAPQQAAPSQLVAAPEPTEAIKSITAQVTSALHQKPEARSILQDATKITKKIASHARQARAAVPVRAHGAPAKHPRATHADHHPAPTAAPMAHLQVAKHASLAASAPVRTAAASATLTAASEHTSGRSPFDSDGTSTHHQPATAPSVASAAAGTTAAPGVVPGTTHASDVLGLLLTAAHAGDDVLPSGPAGSTDDSPD